MAITTQCDDGSDCTFALRLANTAVWRSRIGRSCFERTIPSETGRKNGTCGRMRRFVNSYVYLYLCLYLCLCLYRCVLREAKASYFLLLQD
jgi:hypothetical protein